MVVASNIEEEIIETHKIEGLLKWFDRNKGYGFIMPDDGSEDILLHNDVLREYGNLNIKPGTKMSCEIMKSPKGLMATRILKVLTTVSDMASTIAPENRNIKDNNYQKISRPENTMLAIVKWYDERKGFGFAVSHDDDGDIMLSRQILRNCGIRNVLPGDKIRISVGNTDRGRIAEYAEFC